MLERCLKTRPRIEPDSGSPTVRDRRAAFGNVALGAGLRPTSKGVEEPPYPDVRAPSFCPERHKRLATSVGRASHQCMSCFSEPRWPVYNYHDQRPERDENAVRLASFVIGSGLSTLWAGSSLSVLRVVSITREIHNTRRSRLLFQIDPRIQRGKITWPTN